MGWGGVGLDGMGCGRLGWDGMGRIGMGLDWIGTDGMIWGWDVMGLECIGWEGMDEVRLGRTGGMAFGGPCLPPSSLPQNCTPRSILSIR